MKKIILFFIILCCVSINTMAQSPIANFMVDKDTTEQYQIVNFTDLSSNNPTSWEWEIYDSSTYRYDPKYANQGGVIGLKTGEVYKDNNNSSLNNPSFIFNLVGKYTVVLTVKNSNGTGIKVVKKCVIVTRQSQYYMGFSQNNHTIKNTLNISNQSGSFTDNGGPNLNYSRINNTNINKCRLLIKPCNADSIVLQMKQLKFKDSNDVLKIYDGNEESFLSLIATYTIGNTNNRKTTAYSGSMLIVFEYDSTGFDSGYYGVFKSYIDTSSSANKLKSDFITNSTYYNGIPFKLVNSSNYLSAEPYHYWYLDNQLHSENYNANFDLYLDGFYNIKLLSLDCENEIVDSITKRIKIITPHTKTKVNFKAVSNGNISHLTAITEKANRFEWKISPNTYVFKNPIQSTKFYPGSITSYGFVGDSIFVPIIEFLDTVCYTITLTAYYSSDSVNTTNSIQKVDYLCPNKLNDKFIVHGHVFNDLNNNCSKEILDLNIITYPVMAYNLKNEFIGLTYTDEFGYYSMLVKDTNINVKIGRSNNYYSSCNNPGYDSIINVLDSNYNGVNFPLKIIIDNSKDSSKRDTTVKNPNISCFDVNKLFLSYPFPDNIIFPGENFNLSNYVHTSNIPVCLQNYKLINYQIFLKGKVKLITYNQINGAQTNNSDSSINYIFNQTKTLNFGSTAKFTVDTLANSGDTIHVDVALHYIYKGDTFYLTKKIWFLVENSYDPNNKIVYPVDVEPNYKDWLYYTVNFQNLGTAPAINIKIRDPIDSKLDVETFELISHSHSSKIFLDNRNLLVKFDDIVLEDSMSNPEGSKGYFIYRIKPLVGLKKGERVLNTAYIYFDYNPAVITNTTINNCVIPKNHNISGNVFIDYNENCKLDSGERKLNNFPIYILDSSLNPIKTLNTNINGYYKDLVKKNNYYLKIDTTGTNFKLACNQFAIDNYINKDSFPNEIIINFPLTCKNKDNQIKNIEVVRHGERLPGKLNSLHFSVKNKYTQNCLNTYKPLFIKISTQGPILFISTLDSTPNPDTFINNTLIYHNSTFEKLNDEYHFKYVILNEAKPMDVIEAKIEYVYISNNDTFVESKKINDEIIGPKIQTYLTSDVSELKANSNQWINYTIQFQNIGNTTTNSIRMIDTLSPLFDLSTLRLINSSHPFASNLINNVLIIDFNSPNLSYKNFDSVLSKGYFNFKIKTILNLHSDDSILNNIHFITDSLYFEKSNTWKINIKDNSSTLNNQYTNIKLFPNHYCPVKL